MQIMKPKNGLLALIGGGIRRRLIELPQLFFLGILLLAPAHAAADVDINSTNFPDEAFRTYVQKLAGGTTLTQAEIDATTSFGYDLKNLGIKDLTGLKYFTALTSLFCQDNPGLTFIDLSGNKALKVLNITGCKVRSLDFTNNPNMTSINCAEMKTLTSINVSSCSGLTELYLPNNPLTTLDVTHNPKLQKLSVYKTQLTTLDLSANTALTTLYAFGNPQLKPLDLTHNTLLTYLSVYDNQWSALDVSNFPNLQTLLCFNNQLTSLDVSKNTKLTALSCYGNELTTLDLTNNTAILQLDCSKNRLTSLILNPTSPTQMTFVSVHDNALASINLSDYTKLADKKSSLFVGASSDNQKRRMMLYTDGTNAYMNVEDGINVSKISKAQLNLSDGTTTSLTFSLGTPSNGMVPLKFSNGSVRTRLFNYTTNSTGTTGSTATITYTYDTGSTLSETQTMNVTDTVECYLLPMSQEYGSVNLPYDVLLPEGATAYAVTATSAKDNKATLTQIATAGEVVAANTPMLIRRTDNTHTLFALNAGTGAAKTATSNLLKGTYGTTIDNQSNYYVLGINNTAISPSIKGKLGFWRSSNSKIGIWRAYIDLGSAATANAKGFVLSFDNDTPTGISQIENVGDSIHTPWYTLDGRQSDTKPSQRGIYIHNGKKIIINQ
jgi:hypothetical protein